MSEHTKLPWDRDEGGFTIYSLETNEVIATMASDDAVIDNANAALIVRAVNCHDELVAALAACAEHRLLWSVRKKVETALVKARGEN